eukprot:jgi/Botrbrau1/10791/Bobra.0119s0017.1
MDCTVGPDGSGLEPQRRRGFFGTEETFKTKICERWSKGECRFKDKCAFGEYNKEYLDKKSIPHGEHELRKRLPKRAHAGAAAAGTRNLVFPSAGVDQGVLNNYGELANGIFPFVRTNSAALAAAKSFMAPSGPHNVHGASTINWGPVTALQRDMSLSLTSDNNSLLEDAYAFRELTSRIDGTNMQMVSASQQQAPVHASPSMEGPDLDGWMRYKHLDSGRYYYHNPQINRTQWDMPTSWIAWESMKLSASHGQSFLSEKYRHT